MTTRSKINNMNAFSEIQDQLTDLVLEYQDKSKNFILSKLEIDFKDELEEDEIDFIYDRIDEIRDCYSISSDN